MELRKLSKNRKRIKATYTLHKDDFLGHEYVIYIIGWYDQYTGKVSTYRVQEYQNRSDHFDKTSEPSWFGRGFIDMMYALQ